MGTDVVKIVQCNARPIAGVGEVHASDMIFISGGTFRMGSDRHYPEEAPCHTVGVDGFWIDRTPV
jgi:formylglycine-generating enzyme